MRTFVFTSVTNGRLGPVVWIVADNLGHAQAFAKTRGLTWTGLIHSKRKTVGLMLGRMHLINHLLDKDGNEIVR